LLKNYRGKHIGLLAPLVIARKGVYTELADWARPRGYTHLRVDGEFLPTTGFPAHRPFQGTHDRVAGGRHPRVGRTTKPRCAQALDQRSNMARAWCMCWRRSTACATPCVPAAAHRQTRQAEVFSTKRACPVCATSYPELDPRIFSYNSKHGWCPDCVGTGLKLTKDQRKVFDDSIVGARRQQGPRADLPSEAEIEDLARRDLPHLRGHAPECPPRAP
jgi:excinuclease ABC subunit A